MLVNELIFCPSHSNFARSPCVHTQTPGCSPASVSEGKDAVVVGGGASTVLVACAAPFDLTTVHRTIDLFYQSAVTMATIVLLLQVLIFSCKNIEIQFLLLSLCTSLNLSRFADFSSCVKIHQPPVVISREGNPTVTLQCEQDHQYYHMYWYRQGTSRAMQRLAFSYRKDSSSTEAPFNTSKFIMSRPALLMSSLQIKSVGVADSAVYYCASSVAQWFRKPQQFDNNLRSSLKVVLTSLMFQMILPRALPLLNVAPLY